MGKLRTFFNKNGIGAWIFLFSLTIFAFYLVVFFAALSSKVSDYSWGDVIYHHQLFYNFLHGRPFQTSVYWHALIYSKNPYAYLNTFNIHLYLSPFLFSPLYLLNPNLNGLYSVWIAVTYISLAFFIWKLVCFFTVKDRLPKYLLVMSFVLTNALIFSLVVGKASPIVLGTPFLLAAYYFLQRERYLLFYLCSILFCLSYDDCGLLFISFLPYVYFFERKHLKPALITAVVGLLSVGLIVGVLQPLGRAGFPGKSTASMLDQFRLTWSLLNDVFLFDYVLKTFMRLSFFGLLFLAIPVALLWTKKSGPQPQDLYRCLGLIFLAPLSHWASIVINVGVHFMPVVVFSTIAVTLIISRSSLAFPVTWPRQGRQGNLALVIIGLCFALNLFVFTYPKLQYINDTYHAEKEANAHCLQNVNRFVPLDASLTFWTARGIAGFLGNRSDFWIFPHYYDQTDFLVMQKNSKNTFFQVKIVAGQDLDQILRNGTYHSSGEKIEIDSKIIGAVCDKLVKVNQSHTIVFEDMEMVILKRKEHIRFEQPPETRGFGFFLIFPKYWRTKFSG